MSVLRDAVTEIQTAVAAVTGIRKAPVDAPPTLPAMPCSIAYPQAGRHAWRTPSTRKGYHNIVVEIHVGLGGDFARAINDAYEYSDTVPNAIMLGLDDGTYTHIINMGEITYTFGKMGYGNTETIGFRYVVNDVYIRNDIE